MLDIKWIKNNAQSYDQRMQKRNCDFPSAEFLISIYNQKCELQRRIEQEKNLIKKGKEKDKSLMIELNKEFSEVEQKLHSLLSKTPNLPNIDVPETEEVFYTSPVQKCDFQYISHDKLGKHLGMDSEKAVRMSGKKFILLHGGLALMERALINFMLDFHVSNGYSEVSVPYLVQAKSMYSTGQLPKFYEEAFCTTDEKWLIPTGEVPLTNMFRESIINSEQLPQRYVACTPCFRSEAGAAHKNSKGLIRLHQFNKVELFHACHPEDSSAEFDLMFNQAISILTNLDLPYRLVAISSKEMGFAAAKQYDIEVWMPSQNCYVEISSCSNCKDFQARRMRGKVRKNTLDYLHTMNGSALAVGRTIAAIIENYQNKDRSVTVPHVLRGYMSNMKIIKSIG